MMTVTSYPITMLRLDVDFWGTLYKYFIFYSSCNRNIEFILLPWIKIIKKQIMSERSKRSDMDVAH